MWAVAPDPFDSCIVEQGDSLRDRVLHPETYKAGVAWQFGRGVIPEAAITVFNTGKANRVFSFVPSPIAGAEGTTAALVVTPDSAMLSPGQSTAVRMQCNTPWRSNPRSITKQRWAHVERDASGHVEIDQGDAPTFKRAHHCTTISSARSTARPSRSRHGKLRPLAAEQHSLTLRLGLLNAAESI